MLAVRLLLLSALVAGCSVAASGSYTYTAKGRVVDQNGHAVAGAVIDIMYSGMYVGDAVELPSTDASGRFTLTKRTDRPVFDWKFWAEDWRGVPADTNEIVGWHKIFCSEFYKKLCGIPIYLRPNRTTDLGDLKIPIRQVPLLVRFADSDGISLIS